MLAGSELHGLETGHDLAGGGCRGEYGRRLHLIMMVASLAAAKAPSSPLQAFMFVYNHPIPWQEHASEAAEDVGGLAEADLREANFRKLSNQRNP